MSDLELGDLTIRSYQPGDEDAILESFNRVFGEICGEGYVDRDLAFWRWEFLDNPMGHRISVAVTGDGVVAAHYAAVPVAMATSFGDAIFVQGVDSFTHPDYRRGLKRPGLNFYGLRHTFRTVADASKDQPAIDHIMGHSRDDMASMYREEISDQRLLDVVNVVHNWLFG